MVLASAYQNVCRRYVLLPTVKHDSIKGMSYTLLAAKAFKEHLLYLSMWEYQSGTPCYSVSRSAGGESYMKTNGKESSR